MPSEPDGKGCLSAAETANVGFLVAEAFPCVIVRRLTDAGYRSLGTRDRAAARRRAVASEVPRRAGTFAGLDSPEEAARRREILESELACRGTYASNRLPVPKPRGIK